VKKIIQIVLIFAFFLLHSGCFFFYENPEEHFNVIYNKGMYDTGNAPNDPNIYSRGDTITVLDKGDLKNEDNLFLGWKFNDTLYQPGYVMNSKEYAIEKGNITYLTIVFTAHWDIKPDFEFVIEGEEAILTKYNGRSFTSAVIPAMYDEKPVTRIGDDAFRGKGMYNIRLHGNLKTIGAYAFANCNMTSLTIPDSLEAIGDCAFDNNSINKITFGTGLSSIPQGAFKRNNIQSLRLPDNITLVEDEAFAGNNISQIIIGANVEIESDTSFGTNGASFKKFYDDSGKQAGEYGYTADFWVKL